jgi:hypothetical protein
VGVVCALQLVFIIIIRIQRLRRANPVGSVCIIIVPARAMFIPLYVGITPYVCVVGGWCHGRSASGLHFRAGGIESFREINWQIHGCW